jgi:uncharacterized protein YybS (DUF2232 family)
VNVAAAILLIAAAVFLMRLALRRPSSNLAVASGGCVALTAWFLPAALTAGVLLAAPLLDARWPMRARIHLAGSGLLGLAVLLLPWVLARA